MFFLIVVLLISCSKPQCSDLEVVNRFTSAMNFIDDGQKFSDTICYYPVNPFDNAGAIHNDFIESMLKDVSVISDSIALINAINSYTHFNLDNLNVFRHIMNIDYPMAFNQEGTYLSTAVNSFSHIPSLEKAILNAFYTNLDKCDDKIAACKRAELFIVESDEIKKESKERLLSAMAIYRYSTFLWMKKNADKPKGKNNWEDVYNRFDALGVHLACNYDDEILDTYGVDIQDGKDIYHYAGMVSLSVAVLYVTHLQWFF